MRHYKIGQAAKKLDVSAVTLRYYEKVNLVSPSYRSEAGYRMYTDQDITTLKFVINAKQAGLSLKEIKKILDIENYEIKGSQKVKKIIEDKIISLEKSINNMNYVLSYLNELNNLCNGQVSVEQCPILLSLKDDK